MEEEESKKAINGDLEKRYSLRTRKKEKKFWPILIIFENLAKNFDNENSQMIFHFL